MREHSSNSSVHEKPYERQHEFFHLVSYLWFNVEPQAAFEARGGMSIYDPK